jgi:His/Glu/Gln/Arg/opine family amino acid ABC transporter permease subunit
MLRLLNDGRVRGWLAQGFIALGVLAVVWFFVANAAENLARGGVATGFDFLWARSGVDIDFKLIEYGPDSSYARLLLLGIVNTLFVSAVGILIGTILGFAVGIGRLSQNWLLSGLATVYVEAVRNVPLLLFVLLWYYLVIRAAAPRQTVALRRRLQNTRVFLPRRSRAAFWWLPSAAGLGATVAGAGPEPARRDRPHLPTLETGWLIPGCRPGAVWSPGGMELARTARLRRARRGVSVIPEFLALLAATHGGLHRRDRARRHPVRHPRPARGSRRPRARPAAVCACRHAAGDAGDHPPLTSQYRQRSRTRPTPPSSPIPRSSRSSSDRRSTTPAAPSRSSRSRWRSTSPSTSRCRC